MAADELKNEFYILRSNTRLNRLRFMAYVALLGIINFSIGLVLQILFYLCHKPFDIKIFVIVDTIIVYCFKTWLIVRRLNDFDYDWFSSLIPIIFLLMMFTASFRGNEANATFFGAISSLSIFFIGLIPGDSKPNNYGEVAQKNNKWLLFILIGYVVMLNFSSYLMRLCIELHTNF